MKSTNISINLVYSLNMVIDDSPSTKVNCPEEGNAHVPELNKIMTEQVWTSLCLWRKSKGALVFFKPMSTT